MTANVTIDVATVKDVLRIPNAALRFRPEEKEGAAAASTRSTPTPAAGASPEERAARGSGDHGPVGAARQLDRTGGGGKSRKTGQTVYTPGAMGEPKPAEIRTGITDGRYTQVVSGDVKPGDTVIVGLVTAKAEVSRPPGAGGGRRF
jgi:HlyD family secretion protein